MEPPTTPPAPRPNSATITTLGNYELLDLIGQGPRTRVYRARDFSLRRNVAVKELQEEYRTEPGLSEHFWREAQFFAGLKHPNVVRVLAVEKEKSWLIMELMDGHLAQLVGRVVNPDIVRSILRQGLEALKYLHDKNRVHGGVKPSNLLFDREGKTVCLADSSGAVDEFGTFRTPDNYKYLAPELLNAEFGRPGPATDLYCLGFTALELLMGPAFQDQFQITEISTDTDWARWHSSPDEVPPIEKLIPGTPEDVAEVVARLLRKKPSDRYPSAVAALQNLSDKPLVSVKTAIPVSQPEEEELPQDFVSKLKRFYSTQPLVAWPATLLVLLVLLLGLSALTAPEPPKNRTVIVIADPDGATVIIDGKKRKDKAIRRGTTYYLGTEIAIGSTIKVRVENEGYQPVEKTVAVGDPDLAPPELRVTLVPIKRAAAVQAKFQARLEFKNGTPPRGLLYGQLASLTPTITDIVAEPKELAGLAQVYFRVTTTKGFVVEGDNKWVKPEQLASFLQEKAGGLGESLVLELGVGVPDASRYTDGNVKEILPEPSSLQRFYIGHPLPAGVTPLKNSDKQDAKGRWFAVVRRDLDGAPMSVFWDEASASWWFVDQELVSVTRFVDRFIKSPTAEEYYRRACQDMSGLIPDSVFTYKSVAKLIDPTDISEQVNPKTPAQCAKLLAQGPFLYNPNPKGDETWHRGYASKPLAQDFPDTLPKKELLPDANTDQLPVLGIGYIDARAYQLWLTDRTNTRDWKLCTPERWALVNQPPADAALPKREFAWPVAGTPKEKIGLGPYDLWFIRGNLLELGERPGGVGDSELFGEHFSGVKSADSARKKSKPFYRSVQCGFRFHLVVDPQKKP